MRRVELVTKFFRRVRCKGSVCYMRIVILKLPYLAPEFCEGICNAAEQLEYDIAGIVSLEKNISTTSVKSYPVRPLNEIYNLSWDIAVAACYEETFDDIVPHMVDLKIGTAEQFKNFLWLFKQLMMVKYEDCADPIIQETLNYWQTHKLSFYNQHIDLTQGTLDKVFFDEDLPYIYFKTVGDEHRKMYFPPDTNFSVYNDEKFLENLLKEQDPTSPHLYTTDEHKVNAGDILIDAGVAEGNFALKYVDICSRIYLFEPDEKWIETLRHTFKDYGDKVEIIPCFVSDYTEYNVSTIDDVLPDFRGENIFLKMDVEGSEPDALRGAKRILTNNRVRASVCTYHNAEDLVRVKSILRRYGYKTSTSDGYMIFINDPKIFDTADFRKGVVRAVNF